MLIKIVFFVTVLILSVNAYHSNDDDACSAIGSSCNPADTVPCCDDAVPCQPSETPGLYICMEKELLGSACINNHDCSKFRGAKCLNNKCQCSSGFVELNKTTCAPKIGEYCFNESCAVQNSVCINYKCQCSPDYRLSNNRCVATRLNQFCATNDDCAEIASSVCSPSKICICPLKFVQHGLNQCLSALGGTCSADSDCAASNSHCIDTQCQCKPKYAASGSECEQVLFNGTCRDSFDCQDFLNTICSEDNRCHCDSDSIEKEGQCVALLGGFCYKDSDCLADNSFCMDNICQCGYNNVLKSHRSCTPKSLGMACEADRDCDLIKNSKCIDSVCQCKDKHFAKNDFLCAPIIGGHCSNNTECFFNTLHCIDNQCQCSEDFTAISSSQCVTTRYLYSCQHVSECADSWHSQCFNNKCVCKFIDNISLSRAMCLPLLGGTCWKDDQCITEHSSCINFKCQCSPGFVSAAKNFCVKA